MAERRTNMQWKLKSRGTLPTPTLRAPRVPKVFFCRSLDALARVASGPHGRCKSTCLQSFDAPKRARHANTTSSAGKSSSEEPNLGSLVAEIANVPDRQVRTTYLSQPLAGGHDAYIYPRLRPCCKRVARKAHRLRRPPAILLVGSISGSGCSHHLLHNRL